MKNMFRIRIVLIRVTNKLSMTVCEQLGLLCSSYPIQLFVLFAAARF